MTLWIDLIESEISIVGGQYPTRVLTADEGTPIVLLHGQGGSLENFRHNVPALAARYHVVAPDLRWHGRSDTPPVDRRLIPVWVNQVLDLMQELKRGPSHLLGQSLGGWVAATIALQHPELVRSLVLTTPMGLDPGAPAGHESLAPVLKAQIAALDELSMDSIRARMSPLFGDSDLLDDEIIGVRHAFYSDPDVNRALREVASAYLGSTDTDPYRLGPDALAQISVPNPPVLGHAQFRRRRSRRRPRPGLARNRRVPLRGRGPLGAVRAVRRIQQHRAQFSPRQIERTGRTEFTASSRPSLTPPHVTATVSRSAKPWLPPAPSGISPDRTAHTEGQNIQKGILAAGSDHQEPFHRQRPNPSRMTAAGQEADAS